MVSVFLTYRQVNRRHPDHKARVREFALRLRGAGLTVILDQLADEEEFHYGGPSCENGWGGWSYAQVEKADKVLIVGSIDYYLVYEGNEEPSTGLGSGIEAHRIFTKLYKERGKNDRFRAVILTDEDEAGIPDHFSDFSRFYPNRSPDEFDRLVSWLTAGSSVPTSPPSEDVAWPPAISTYVPDQANRDIEFDFFVSLLQGDTPERAVFFEGPGNRGKTTLIRECMRYAQLAVSPAGCVAIDFNSDSSKEGALDTLRLDLGSQLPHFSRPNGSTFDLRGDLRALTKPTVLLFDTYEKASPQARELIATILLGELEKLPAIRIIIAGKEVPEHAKAIWARSVRYFPLGPINDPQHWARVAATHHPNLKTEHVEAVTFASAGEPGSVRAGLQAVAASLEKT
jgi:hypothetical protein